jgi:uncharacterized C2H2 Zn-finger protein
MNTAECPECTAVVEYPDGEREVTCPECGCLFEIEEEV